VNELVRWETAGGAVVVEADARNPGFQSISRSPGQAIHDVKGQFEDALENVRNAAVCLEDVPGGGPRSRRDRGRIRCEVQCGGRCGDSQHLRRRALGPKLTWSRLREWLMDDLQWRARVDTGTDLKWRLAQGF